MRQFRTVLLLAALGCGGATGRDTAKEEPGPNLINSRIPTNGGAAGSEDVGTGGTEAGGAGGSGGTSAGAGGDSQQGGTGGVTANGGSDQGGSDQGGSGGSAAGTGGSDQGGSGGSNQGGTGGSDPDPAPPACTFDLDHGGPGSRCSNLLFETCTVVQGVAVYGSTQCGTAETGFNCDSEGGCNGDCSNGDVRCSGDTAETCVSGAWETTEECSFQCVDGACEGACEPGGAVCDGASVVTCGEDFRYGNAVACEDAPNANPTCSGAGECGTACVPGFDDCSAAPGCETDLSSPDSCGSCDNVCPGAPNATRTCNGGVCGLEPNACAEGTANCTGDFVCETNTSNDPDNCGGCGISCYGASCNQGECTGGSLVADLGITGEPRGLTVDGAYLYWIDISVGTNPIRRTLKDGSGNVETLANADAASFPFELQVGGGYVFYVRADAVNQFGDHVGGIYKVAVTGGTPVKLVDMGLLNKPEQPNKTLEITLSGDDLYWTDSNVSSEGDLCFVNYPSLQVPCTGGTVFASSIPDHGDPPEVHIYRTDVNGGGTTLVTTLPGAAEYDSHIEIVGNQVIATQYVHLYYGAALGYGYESRVKVFNLSTGVFVKSYSGSELTVLNDLQVSSSQVAFWSRPVAGDSRCLTTIALSSEAGAGYTCVTQDADALLLVDSADVYYQNNGALLRRPVGGGSAEVLAPSAQQVTVAAQDGSFVYWAVDVTGTDQKAILRAAK